MIQHLKIRLGKGVSALAVALIAILVVQLPVTIVDRTLHSDGQDHVANAFAGPLAVDLATQDHDHVHQSAPHHQDDDVAAADLPGVDDDHDPSPPQGAHHHHDGPSFLGLGAVWAIASPRIVLIADWPGPDTALASAQSSPQRRPPKASLEHVV